MYTIDYTPYKFRDWISLDKIDWYWLSQNPSIFKVDYTALNKRIDPFKEELMQKCFHPKRLVYYLEQYNYDIGGEEYT